MKNAKNNFFKNGEVKMKIEDRRIAMLIDADNIAPKYLKDIFDEISDYGVVTYKRIYGDWTSGDKKSWKRHILEWSINPMQQYSYTTGKNATDSAMIIDAMDILYSENIDGFCLVSSDSDFTKLAQRLRESGKYVVGMGESKTPVAFRKACDTFKILDLLAQENEGDISENKTKNTNVTEDELTSIDVIVQSVRKVILDNTNKGKPTGVGEIGSVLSKKHSDFDVRNYGYSKLTTFLESLKEFEVLIKTDGQTIKLKKTSTTKEDIDIFIQKVLEGYDKKTCSLNSLIRELSKKYPDFSVNQYGYSRFSSFIRSYQHFKVENNSITLI